MDTCCETRTGTTRCDEIAVYLVTAPAVPATPYMPARPAIETLQCGRHAAMWTRCDRKGRPVHAGFTAELI